MFEGSSLRSSQQAWIVPKGSTVIQGWNWSRRLFKVSSLIRRGELQVVPPSVERVKYMSVMLDAPASLSVYTQ